jgi:hypothetical protein
MMAHWASLEQKVIRKPDDVHEIALYSQIRQHVNSLGKPARIRFIQSADALALSALLTAPSYLSRLSDEELTVSKARAEQLALPKEILETRNGTVKRMAEAGTGFERAIRLIADKGGLVGDGKGGWRDPLAETTTVTRPAPSPPAPTATVTPPEPRSRRRHHRLHQVCRLPSGQLRVDPCGHEC